MRLTVPIVAALFIASAQGAPTPREPTERAEDPGHGATTGPPPVENTHKLYIQGLPQPCTDDELRALWWDDVRGKITKISIPVHADGHNKDYAHVEFDSDEDMQAALRNNAGASVLDFVVPLRLLTVNPMCWLFLQVIKGNVLSVRASSPDLDTETGETETSGSFLGGRGGATRGVLRGRGRGRGALSVRTANTPPEEPESDDSSGGRGGAARGGVRGGVRGGARGGRGRGRGALSVRTTAEESGDSDGSTGSGRGGGRGGRGGFGGDRGGGRGGGAPRGGRGGGRGRGSS
ncbi:hypothetical protein QFC24_005123 [Naganishia onofrii]|uniref:Uncharacterized protein n=1 Tax=Naganishia onofrii TaxID=1851511 RepID=A0ACC2XAL8_9TREE|nr:hypothetical protein QFC24_005123 [Naganishia onofrii]